jgi:pimeloyl-ACP methyl ester carboxylesterase
VNDNQIADAEPEEHPTEGEPKLSEHFQAHGSRWASRSARIALGSTAALVALAAAVNWAARRIERSHPPIGNFIEVDGVRVHYVDVGEGEPVVLLHGNASMLQDTYLGLVDRLAGRHRVIAFDRPGFGYSERPKNVTWTPEAQMELLCGAFTRLGIERPVLYGHSWGAPLVVTYALHRPDDIRGVVAASGYYYPNRRLDAAMAILNGAPIIGPICRNTISPVMNAIIGPLALRLLFSPNRVPPTYAEFPASLSLRPVAIRAAGENGMTLRDWAARTSPHYGEIRAPVGIVVCTDGKAVDYRGHSVCLHHDIRGCTYEYRPHGASQLHRGGRRGDRGGASATS